MTSYALGGSRGPKKSVGKPGAILIKYLFENKIALVSQIHRDLFSNTVQTNTYRILRKLLGMKLIEKGSVVVKNKTYAVYNSTAKALPIIESQIGQEVIRQQYKSNSLVHDLNLVDIRKALLKYKKVSEYYTENMLQCGKSFSSNLDLRPYVDLKTDAVFKIIRRSESQVVPIEFENSAKSLKRTIQKFNLYYQNEMVPYVLYIYSNRETFKKAIDAEKSFSSKADKKFYLASIDEVLSGKEKVIFKNINGDNFVMR